MSEEDQERIEDYLELERWLEDLQAGRVAHPPGELTPTQARIYRMMALFRSASPETGRPDPAFAAELQTRLEQEFPQLRVPHFPSLPKQPQEKRPGVSRRALLTGGAAVAASLVVGAAIEREAEQRANNVGSGQVAYPPLVPPNVPATWYFVTTLADLGEHAVRFATDTIVGYVIYDDGDGGDPDKGKVIALSAACTHQGCILQWQDADRRFHCPCHGGIFSEYGQVDKRSGPVHYLTPLPRLETKVEDGKVYVKVPLSRF